MTVSFKSTLLDVAGFTAIALGFMVVATNRTGFMVIPLISYPRLNLGLTFFSLGWTTMFLRTYSSPSTKPKTRRRK